SVSRRLRNREDHVAVFCWVSTYLDASTTSSQGRVVHPARHRGGEWVLVFFLIRSDLIRLPGLPSGVASDSSGLAVFHPSRGSPGSPSSGWSDASAGSSARRARARAVCRHERAT